MTGGKGKGFLLRGEGEKRAITDEIVAVEAREERREAERGRGPSRDSNKEEKKIKRKPRGKRRKGLIPLFSSTLMTT